MKLINISYIFLFLLVSAFQSYGQTDNSTDSLNFTDSNGLKQGTWREYYIDGFVKTETIYKDGIKNGLDLEFYHYPNCVKTENHYKNDTLVQRIEYYRNCNAKLVEYFKNGNRDGYSRSYDRNGLLET